MTHNAYLGDSDNEWEVEAHWDDLQATESQGTGGAALTYEVINSGNPFKVYSFRTGQTDELHLRYQLPHGWDPGTEAHFHIHGIPLTAANGNVQWEGQYAWVANNSAVPANSLWTPFTKTSAVTTADANKLEIFSIVRITPPAAALESSILFVYLKRIGADGTDTYGGNIGIASVDLHFQKVKMGTLNEVPS